MYDFCGKLDKELAYAHIEAKFAWDKGATESEMAKVLDDIRKSQWRWDYAMAGHGSAFHAPQEVMRLLADAMTYAKDARLQICLLYTSSLLSTSQLQLSHPLVTHCSRVDLTMRCV